MELTVDQALQQGVAAHKEGKFQDAERLYRAILQAQPSHPDANHNLGVLAVVVGKPLEAIPFFKLALDANPHIEQFWLSYVDALIKTEELNVAKRVLADAQQAGVPVGKLRAFQDQLGPEFSASSRAPQPELNSSLRNSQSELSTAIDLRESGKYEQAQEWLNKLVQNNPPNPEALSLLSQVLLLDKKEAEAEKVLKAAASINSELPSVYRNQARLLLKQSKTAEALEKAQLGCRQSLEDPESLLVLAACLAANQRDLEALPLIEKILIADSNYAEAYATRALIKNRTKDRVGAIEDAEMSVSLKPHLSRMWQLLGSLHYQANNLRDAIEALRHAHKNEPNDTAFMMQMAELLRQDNRASEAINILERATELAPEDTNVWANLGIAFQQEKKIADAKIAYERALALDPKSAAIASKLTAMAVEAEEWESALRYFEKKLEIEPNLAEAHSDLGNVLQELGRLDEAEASHRQAIALKPDFAEAHNNLGATLQALGQLDGAEASYRQAIALKPDYAEASNNLGVTLQELGQLDGAEASYRQAIALKPDYAEANYNLGNTLQELGRLDEAEANYRQAIVLKPDYAVAHHNLGNTLQELGGLEEAEASYRQAIVLKPEFAEAHNNLGVTLQELDKINDAISSYVRAIALKADFDSAYSNLGSALKSARFTEANQTLYPILINLLTKKNFVPPKNIGGAILSLIRLDSLIEDMLLNTTDTTKVDLAIKALAQVPLLHQLMRICPLPDLQLEASFVSMRRVLLKDLMKIEASTEVIHFLSTLSLHCFTNEYVYFETEEEAELISALEAAIAERIAQASQPTITETLMLATYRPLHQYDWSTNLQALDQLPEVNVRLIEEPLAERAIAQNILALSNVDDDVSRKVRKQYEGSPYPRWVKLGFPPKAKSIAEVCNEAKLQLHSENIKSVLSPSILVAGCGTGQHSIGTASRFANCKVTAVDLSCSSLAYAQRKTSELGIASIEYLQADILNLGELGQEYDIIESSGVLHHMDDPMAGWRVLVDLLKTGGLMRIGLYSDLARRPILKTRKDIALGGIGTSETEIRQFRQFLVESHDEHHQQLIRFGDFFSLSEVRDLLFHVQEHRFTLPQIQHCCDELGLKFCGFQDKETVRRFKHSFGKDSDACDLSLWHQFEAENPHTFIGMYQFWCQKI